MILKDLISIFCPLESNLPIHGHLKVGFLLVIGRFSLSENSFPIKISPHSHISTEIIIPISTQLSNKSFNYPFSFCFEIFFRLSADLFLLRSENLPVTSSSSITPSSLSPYQALLYTGLMPYDQFDVSIIPLI